MAFINNSSGHTGQYEFQSEIQIGIYIQKAETFLFEYVFPVILSLSSLWNLLIIIYFTKINIKRIRKMSPYHFLLVQLAVADFLVCSGMTFMDHYKRKPAWELGVIGCRFFTVFQGVCPMASFWLLVLLSYARYRSITQPLKQRINKTKFSLACILIWFLTIALSSYLIFNTTLNTRRTGKTTCAFIISESSLLIFNGFRLILDCILPITLVLSFYWKIKNGMAVDNAMNVFASTNQSRQRNQAALRTIESLVILFIVSVVPGRLIHILSSILKYYNEVTQPLFSQTLENYTDILKVVSDFFLFLNHTLNIFIYAKIMPGFRRFL
uniref:G-protein coupled receptors family 1 profile domain-containing protein n=1 Tax=Clytia hemisphaerica TaxID=252671 RepID=A0A7M5XMP8_9CNID